jgi:hypothetical protein
MQTLDAAKLACLASPVRREVFTAFRQLGPGSVREVAEDIGRKVELVHYHTKALVDAGLLREDGRRPTSRKPECLYSPTAAMFRLPNLEADPELAEVTRKAVAAGLRQTTRKYEQAAKAAVLDPSLRNNMSVIQASIRLSPADAETFIGMIEAANRFARDAQQGDGIRLIWSSLVIPEVTRSSRG